MAVGAYGHFRGGGPLQASDFPPAFLVVAIISALSVFIFAQLSPEAGRKWPTGFHASQNLRTNARVNSRYQGATRNPVAKRYSSDPFRRFAGGLRASRFCKSAPCASNAASVPPCPRTPAREAPSGASTSRAKSQRRLHQRMILRWSVRACPVALAAMSEVSALAGPPSISFGRPPRQDRERRA